ncbi:MAG: hypothetical protein KatS3mg053_2062 [Candidatus Roseilinea sp.]|nr:MAG: hypothetical protein KatS3mg053_2062 [Candidatus Roseilinea sp.]
MRHLRPTSDRLRRLQWGKCKRGHRLKAKSTHTASEQDRERVSFHDSLVVFSSASCIYNVQQELARMTIPTYNKPQRLPG